MNNSYISNKEIFAESRHAMHADQVEQQHSVKAKYFRFLNEPTRESQLEAQFFIQEHLHNVALENDALPNNMDELQSWVTKNAEKVGKQYYQYLVERKNGAPRQLFKNKSHALNFIKLVAPTKMVDGSWLHGFIHHADNEKFAKLITIYLDELGNGDVHKNHVVLFRQLLTKYGLDDVQALPDELFVQGAIQLALGCNAEAFIPEIIGFNLAYEQLPLHLMITAFELKELNIDPYYFTLHITVDNALTGHSKMAIDAFKDSMPALGNRKEYMKRVVAGMALNQDGLSTMSIISAYNIDAEIIEIFKQKSTLGQYMHGDHCSIGGKTVNTWLENPDNIPDFLQVLEKNNWINRHEDPKNSRFWRLIEGEKAAMYGVFSAYEKQVIYDWIAGEALESLPKLERLGPLVSRHVTNKQAVDRPTHAQANSHSLKSSNIINMDVAKKSMHMQANFAQPVAKFSAVHHMRVTDDETLFKNQVAKTSDRTELMRLLSQWMSPAKHHSLLGLIATKLYMEQINAAR